MVNTEEKSKMNKQTTLFLLLSLLAINLIQLLSAGKETVKKTLVTVFVQQKIKIDGRLDESFYSQMNPVEDFVQFHPRNGEKPTFKTQVYSFYDHKNIYFAFKCYDENPSEIAADITPFGGYFHNDELTVYLDTFKDKRTYERFEINPKGIMDGKKTLWYGDARITTYGWSAEIKIPFKSLRFPVRGEQNWAVNFKRRVFRLNETAYWTNVERDRQGVLGDTFADLKGLRGIKGGKNIEAFPYAGIRSSKSGDETDNKFAYGLDLKYGITSNLTLDMTSSPDYSEVESDPFFYQLDPFEHYLSENRPFYLEGSSYFETIFDLFYSRRIANPTLAAKVTGKEKGFTLGLLTARNKTDGGESFHGVFRLKKDIFKLSTIGFIYSTIEENGGYNRNFGVDFRFKFKNIYTFYGMIAKSFNNDVPNTGNGMYRLTFLRSVDKGFTFAGLYHRVEPNVYVPAGYMPSIDFHRFVGILKYSFRWEGKWLERFYLRFWKTNEYSIRTPLKVDDSYMFTVSTATRNRLQARISYFDGNIRAKVLDQSDQLVLENKLWPTKSVEIILSYDGSRKINFGSTLLFVRDFVYNEEFTKTRRGKFNRFSMWAKVKFSSQLQWNIDLGRTVLRSDDRTVDFVGNLVSMSVNYQLNKKIASYAKLQYDSRYERFQYDFLVAYQMNNLSSIYLSFKNYSEGRFRFLDPDARSIGFKVSYLVRI